MLSCVPALYGVLLGGGGGALLFFILPSKGFNSSPFEIGDNLFFSKCSRWLPSNNAPHGGKADSSGCPIRNCPSVSSIFLFRISVKLSSFTGEPMPKML
ncbi:hypothetical protein FKM82_030461 [Ascaphus truei]